MTNNQIELVEASKNDTKIAEAFEGFTPAQVAVIKNTVAKGTTDTELALFIYTASSVKLNPLIKEIWCYKDNKGNLLIFAGRDGFLKKAQEHPKFAGMRSCAVRATDKFEIDVPNGKVNHIINQHRDKRGEIIGAYAFVFRKEEEATLAWVDFDTYAKGFAVWKSHPDDMITKVAEVKALKKAFGMAEIQSPYEWQETRDGRVSPIDHQLLPDFKRGQK